MSEAYQVSPYAAAFLDKAKEVADAKLARSRAIAKKVRILNAHHMRYCAGFYPSSGGRAFKARVHQGQFQISYDFQSWADCPDDVKFHDHNGRDINLDREVRA